MINIGKKRECFFDDFLIDTVRTTAETRVHRPVRRNPVFVHDGIGEGSASTFHNFFWDENIGKYRMYYLGRGADKEGRHIPGIRVCYAESEDFENWERPILNIYEFEGSKENHLITSTDEYPRLDNFFVFLDRNPDCPPEEKYKAIMRKVQRGDPKEVHCDFGLEYLASADGVHFKDMGPIHEHAAYDSLNIAFWDTEAKIYRCYFRWNHVPGDKSRNMKMGLGIRDIRYMESKDFKTWSEPVMVDFGEGSEDIPLYTSNAQQYIRAPHIIIGMPTRYIERKVWTKCYDELPNIEGRRKRFEQEARNGLAITDCIFMASRDGHNFKKYEEAFIAPGVEHPRNWRYGDCYPRAGMRITPSDIPGADPELSIYMTEPDAKSESNPNKLWRYTLRCDGFVSRHAGAVEKMLVTKPFIYDGKDMYANIETSARGYMYFTLKSKDGEVIESCEMFGNSIDKKIGFEDGAVERLSGKEVVLEVRMLDADIYAIRFE